MKNLPCEDPSIGTRYARMALAGLGNCDASLIIADAGANGRNPKRFHRFLKDLSRVPDNAAALQGSMAGEKTR
jgi:hypothetical protein